MYQHEEISSLWWTNCEAKYIHLSIPHICHFFYTGKIFGKWNLHRNLHSKLPIYTVNCQFTQWIANLHSKLTIFRVKSVKIYTGQKYFTRIYPWDPWQIWGMGNSCKVRESKQPFWNVSFSDININQGTEEQTHHLPSSVNERIWWHPEQ